MVQMAQIQVLVRSQQQLAGALVLPINKVVQAAAAEEEREEIQQPTLAEAEEGELLKLDNLPKLLQAAVKLVVVDHKAVQVVMVVQLLAQDKRVALDSWVRAAAVAEAVALEGSLAVQAAAEVTLQERQTQAAAVEQVATQDQRQLVTLAVQDIADWNGGSNGAFC
jgi:hypothetical protein